MNLIQLSTILYPSLPGPKPRRISGPRINGELVRNIPITPSYFDERTAKWILFVATLATICAITALMALIVPYL